MSSMPNEAKKNWEKSVKEALDKDDLKKVKTLITQENHNNKVRNSHWEINILDYAIHHSRLDVIKYLCETYPDLLLQVAKENDCFSGPIATVMDNVMDGKTALGKFKYLAGQLKRTGQIRHKEECLFSAIRQGNYELAECIIDEWYSTYLYGNDASAALEAAVSLDASISSPFASDVSENLVKLLISKGADVSKADNILNIAIQKGNEHLGRILVENGANPASLSEKSINKLTTISLKHLKFYSPQLKEEIIADRRKSGTKYLEDLKPLYSAYLKKLEEKMEEKSAFYSSTPITFTDNYIPGKPAHANPTQATNPPPLSTSNESKKEDTKESPQNEIVNRLKKAIEPDLESSKFENSDIIEFSPSEGGKEGSLRDSEIEMNELKSHAPDTDNTTEEQPLLPRDPVPTNLNNSKWPEFFSSKKHASDNTAEKQLLLPKKQATKNNSGSNGEIEMDRIDTSTSDNSTGKTIRIGSSDENG